jgi:hypothetical protein
VTDRTTALDKRGNEEFGGTDLAGTITAAHQMQWDKRLVKVTAGASGELTLPDARGYNPAHVVGHPYGGQAGQTFFVWNVSASLTLPVKDQEGSTIGTVGTEEGREVWLIEDGTQAGSWFMGPARTVTASPTVVSGSLLYFTKTFSESTNWPFNVYLWLRNEHGWDETTAVHVTIVINSGVVLGTPRTDWAAIDSGALPTGSTILIVNHNVISGKGGDGGVGGFSSAFPEPAGNGGNAGPAVYLRGTVTVYVENRGTIQGGGGGGGGGDYGAGTSSHGGGGGGGAGFGVGVGGVGISPATDGIDGAVATGGVGGQPGSTAATAGAPGGAAGAAGGTASGPGGTGGSGGYAIIRESTVTLNLLVAGSMPGGIQVV